MVHPSAYISSARIPIKIDVNAGELSALTDATRISEGWRGVLPQREKVTPATFLPEIWHARSRLAWLWFAITGARDSKGAPPPSRPCRLERVN